MIIPERNKRTEQNVKTGSLLKCSLSFLIIINPYNLLVRTRKRNPE